MESFLAGDALSVVFWCSTGYDEGTVDGALEYWKEIRTIMTSDRADSLDPDFGFAVSALWSCSLTVILLVEIRLWKISLSP
jgi:hypothetical protein